MSEYTSLRRLSSTTKSRSSPSDDRTQSASSSDADAGNLQYAPFMQQHSITTRPSQSSLLSSDSEGPSGGLLFDEKDMLNDMINDDLDDRESPVLTPILSTALTPTPTLTPIPVPSTPTPDQTTSKSSQVTFSPDHPLFLSPLNHDTHKQTRAPPPPFHSSSWHAHMPDSSTTSSTSSTSSPHPSISKIVFFAPLIGEECSESASQEETCEKILYYYERSNAESSSSSSSSVLSDRFQSMQQLQHVESILKYVGFIEGLVGFGQIIGGGSSSSSYTEEVCMDSSVVVIVKFGDTGIMGCMEVDNDFDVNDHSDWEGGVGGWRNSTNPTTTSDGSESDSDEPQPQPPKSSHNPSHSISISSTSIRQHLLQTFQLLTLLSPPFSIPNLITDSLTPLRAARKSLRKIALRQELEKHDRDNDTNITKTSTFTEKDDQAQIESLNSQINNLLLLR